MEKVRGELSNYFSYVDKTLTIDTRKKKKKKRGKREKELIGHLIFDGRPTRNQKLAVDKFLRGECQPLTKQRNAHNKMLVPGGEFS